MTSTSQSSAARIRRPQRARPKELSPSHAHVSNRKRSHRPLARFLGGRLPSESVLWSLMALTTILVVVLLVLLLYLWRSQSLDSSHLRAPRSNPFRQYKVRRQNATKNPIIVVGLPKAGTSSLFEYFRCLGFAAQHWYCCGKQTNAQKPPVARHVEASDAHYSESPGNASYMIRRRVKRKANDQYMSTCLLSNLESNMPLLDGCGDYDVFTEINGPRLQDPTDGNEARGLGGLVLPQHFHLPELHAYAPNATWILNIRPVDDWIASLYKIPGHALVYRMAKEMYTQRQKEQDQAQQYWSEWVTSLFSSFTDSAFPSGYEATEAYLRDFWYSHIQRIADFVDEHPSHRLVVVDINNTQAGEQLAHDLGWTTDNQTGFYPTDDSFLSLSSLPTPVLLRRTSSCWRPHNVHQDY